MENYARYGSPTPSTLSRLPIATSPTGVVITGGLRRRAGADVCPHAGLQQSHVQGTALPIATPVVNGFDVTPMADVRLVKFRSGSQASPLTG